MVSAAPSTVVVRYSRYHGNSALNVWCLIHAKFVSKPYLNVACFRIRNNVLRFLSWNIKDGVSALMERLVQEECDFVLMVLHKKKLVDVLKTFGTSMTRQTTELQHKYPLLAMLLTFGAGLSIYFAYKSTFGMYSSPTDKVQDRFLLMNNSNSSLNISAEYEHLRSSEWDKHRQCGVIWHYHIGKTGGTNLGYILRRKYKARKHKFMFELWSKESSYNKEDAFYFKLIPFLKAHLHRDNILYIHHHHRSYGFAQFVSLGLYDIIVDLVEKQKQCNILFVTLFREPIKRLLSHLAYDGHNISDNANGDIDKLITETYANVQVGYLNYNMKRKQITQLNPLNDTVFMNTLKLVKDYFDIIGFCEKYNQFLAKLYNATNIEYDVKNEFNKVLYIQKKNKLKRNQKIENIDTHLLKLMITSQAWDFKLYYQLRMEDDKMFGTNL